MAEFKNLPTDELARATTESWRTMRIMAELVTALDILGRVKTHCVSIFGSARCKPESPEYKDAEEIARQLVRAGYGIITGGGPGAMEAANKGAYEENGVSIGLHIKLPMEQGCNPYVTTRCDFHYFFIRKFMFVKYASAYIVLPGGMGTIDELSEAFVLAQTGRSRPFPIILFNSSFWKGFVDWLKNSMAGQGYITGNEISRLISVCDTPEEIVAHLQKFIIL